MQEVDNERRMRILRGLPVEDLPEAIVDPASNDRSNEPRGPGRERKRRRIAGEDDTDRDMRYAIEDRETMHDRAHKDILKLKSKSADAPILDRAGHIDLFPAEARAASRKEKAKNPEKEAEDARKKQDYEDQYTMRFSNAAGFKQSVDQKPWYYANAGPAGDETEAVEAKDALGNEGPRRKERQKLKMASDDPLAAIQRGVQAVRKAEREKKHFRDERLAEVDDLIRLERKEAKRRKRHHRRRSEEDGLENFSLDSAEPSRQSKSHGHRHRHDDYQNRDDEMSQRHRHHHRDRHRSRSPRREDGYYRHHTENRAVSA